MIQFVQSAHWRDESSCMKTTTKRTKKTTTRPAYEAAYAECAEMVESLPRLLADHKDEISTADPTDLTYTEDLVAAQDHLRCPSTRWGT
jgi:hypothetical protein